LHLEAITILKGGSEALKAWYLEPVRARDF